jgi:pSer/pThr/pTyr-binding forkhead associated (FHA) protein
MDVKMLIVQGRPRGKYLCFPQGEFVFGRGPECHIRPNSPWVSRQHCLLRIDKDGVLIRDLGSTNGTLVNGTRLIGERTLGSGDQLQVGPLVLQVVLEESGAALPAEPTKDDTGVFCMDTAQMKQQLASVEETEVPVP